MKEQPPAVNKGIHAMIFFWLALLALTFGLLGFLLHASYFGRRKSVEENLNDKIGDMKKALALREIINADAQDDLAHSRMMVKSLERQLEQRNEQLSALQSMTRRQEEEIRLLQQATSEIRLSIARTEESSAVAPEPGVLGPQPAQDAREQKMPLWKDNLNNILTMLDKLEKETRK